MKVFTRLLSVVVVFAFTTTLVFGQTAGEWQTKVANSQTADMEVSVLPGSTPTPVEGDYTKYVTSDGTKDVLWDNGPFITEPGGGSGGTDYSALQDASLGMGTYGAGFQIASNNSIADDFDVTGSWNVNTITVYGYQTGSGPPSTLNDVRMQIWDGDPMAGGSVIWGDMATNLMISTDWTNVWRVLESAPAENRPIMEIVADVSGLFLNAGTYWVEYSVGGTGTSGPWAPYITILGQTTTGNALQSIAGAWAPLEDGGTLTPQGLPFIIEGTFGSQPANDLTIQAIVSPNTSPDLTDAEEIVVDIKNNGTAAQSGFDVYFTVDGGSPVVETVSATINSGDTYTHTFATTVDMSAPLTTWTIMACTDLTGDEVPDNDCKSKDVFNSFGDYCDASGGGDEFIDGVEFGTISNMGTGATGYGDYTAMSTDVLPGNTYTISLTNGNPYTSDDWGIWIDLNQNGSFDDAGENVVCEFNQGDVLTTYDITIPGDAMEGSTRMRIRLKWSGDDCGSSCGATTYGEVEDYSLFIGEGVYLDPPTDLTAVVFDDNDVELNWTSPGGTTTGEWIQWDAGTNTGNGIGLTSGGTFYCASHWMPAELAAYDGMEVTKLSIFPNGDAAATFKLMIWTGADASTLVMEQTVAVTVDEFNEIDLDSPVTIDASMEYWFGYEVTHGAGTFPAGCDDGPAVQFSGDMLSTDGVAWVSMGFEYALDYNWNIAAYVAGTDDASPITPMVKNYTASTGSLAAAGPLSGKVKAFAPSVKALQSFNVYRDDAVIGNTDMTTYTDMDLAPGDYEYYVTAVYDEGESGETNHEFVTIADLPTIIFFDDFEAYTTGEQVACQNPDDWTTWSNLPCDATEDAYVSDMYAYSGDNSVNIVTDNDLVYNLAEYYTSGAYKVGMMVYVPSGNSAYINVMSDFDGAYEWGFEVYFNTDLTGDVNGGGTGAASFTYTQDAWMMSELIVDLDADWAQYYLDGVMIHEWQWTVGAAGGGAQLQLAAVDFFGDAATTSFYFDDFTLDLAGGSSPLDPPMNVVATATGDDVYVDWDAPSGGGSEGTILVVDRDGSSAVGGLGFTDDWAIIQPALDAIGADYTYYEVEDLLNDGPDLAMMEAYDMIIWFCGEGWQADQTMTDTDEANVAAYLDGGGSFFLSGHDYFWDKYPSAGNFSAGQFPYDYLGVSSTSQDAWNVFAPDLGTFAGEAGSFADGLTFSCADVYTTDGKDGLYIDQMVAMDQALFGVTSPTPAGVCGVQYDGGTFKTAFTTASLGAFTVQAELEAVLTAAIDYMTGSESDALTGYNVYRDGALLGYTTATDYTDMNLANGTYEYCVTAVYDEGESDPVCDMATVNAGPSVIFEDDFEAYTAGEQLACQNPDDWTTWSNAPCGAEDAYISTDFANSGVNAAVIETGNDVVKVWDNYTTGHYLISFQMLVPTGFYGYFNTLQDFAGTTSQWGMQVYFDAGGAGLVDAGGAGSATFTYSYDTWILNEVDVDLDNDWAQYYVDGALVVEWQWSTGSFGTGTLNQLGGNNFYAWEENGPPKFYFDDVMLTQVSQGAVLPEPTALAGEDVGCEVELTWDEPAGGATGVFQHYNVFRNGTDIADVTTESYNDTDVTTGAYAYYVTAVYSDGESVGSNEVTVNVDCGGTLPAPENLTTTYPGSGFSVPLSWDEPSISEEWIRWDAGNTSGNGIGLTNGGSFNAASHWMPAELAAYDGQILSKISFWNNADPAATFKVRVWVGANASTLLVDQAVTGVTPDEWTEVDLDSPITIDASTELWFGVEITHGAGTFPGGCDDGPAVQFSGDMLSTDGNTWVSMSSEYGLDYNWNLQGFVSSIGDASPAQPLVKDNVSLNTTASFASALETGVASGNSDKGVLSTKELTGYNVYRDGSVVGNTTDTEYTDIVDTPDTYLYCVTAVYDEGESDCSNEIEVDVYVGVEENLFNLTSVYPNPASDVVNIKSAYQIESVKVFNYNGQVVANETVNNTMYKVNTSNFNTGLYFFQIETTEGTISKRVIIE
jgi:hypothetical protein